METGVRLVVGEEDLSVQSRSQLKGEVVLDHAASDDKLRILFDALPSAISRRVQAIVPEDFEIASLKLTMKLDGRIAGVGLAGDIDVTLSPRRRA